MPKVNGDDDVFEKTGISPGYHKPTGILAPGSKGPELGSRVGKEKKSQQR